MVCWCSGLCVRSSSVQLINSGDCVGESACSGHTKQRKTAACVATIFRAAECSAPPNFLFAAIALKERRGSERGSAVCRRRGRGYTNDGQKKSCRRKETGRESMAEVAVGMRERRANVVEEIKTRRNRLCLHDKTFSQASSSLPPRQCYSLDCG